MSQMIFMSRSPDSSTRRTNTEMHSSRIAATMIEAQNIIQPAYIRPDGAGVLVSFGQRLMQTTRSEEHTSELQSPCNLVCRLLLEKKKQQYKNRCILRHIYY